MHLTDVHEPPSSSSHCLLANNPHDQLPILNVHLGIHYQKPYQSEFSMMLQTIEKHLTYPSVPRGDPLVGAIVLPIVVG